MTHITLTARTLLPDTIPKQGLEYFSAMWTHPVWYSACAGSRKIATYLHLDQRVKGLVLKGGLWRVISVTFTTYRLNFSSMA